MSGELPDCKGITVRPIWEFSLGGVTLSDCGEMVRQIWQFSILLCGYCITVNVWSRTDGRALVKHECDGNI